MSEAPHVIVLGTGGAGLTAAISAHEAGARVSLFEKGDQVGGTTAWSGGMIWIPNNHHEGALGVEDSRDKALTYLMSMSHGLMQQHLVEAFLDHGPEMVAFLEANTPVQFRPIPEFPDYHAEFPGGMPNGGRSLDCPLFSFHELGEWADKVTLSPYYPMPYFSIYDTPLGQAKPQPLAPEELKRRIDADLRGSGQALVGRLLRACLDRRIEPQTGHRAARLIMDGDRVAGVVFETADGEVEIAADAVVLATGGFEWDKDLLRAFIRGPMTHPLSPKTNTGDGLKMAMRVGAMLGNMREAWWMPVAEVPESECSTGKTLVAGQRSLPHSIMVNRAGKRFTNEAANYNAIGAAFHDQDVSAFDYKNLPCWLIFDEQYIDRFGFGMISGERGVAPPQWAMRAESLAELAARLGIDADALEATVERFNGHCATGRDPDFGRGDAAHDQWWGDPDGRGSTAATLGPIGKGPFFAVEIKSGALGTKGGPQTDANAQVLSVDGGAIPGLYAAGNVMASAMGMTYGGPGGTIAPGMVFGFLAGRHAARVSAKRLEGAV
ncbi:MULTISPECIES: FAD-dependent oxidoreductase [unclassified Sphingopyxis]|uniref:FAD-dependent oxidoreductase n=1 Tax=unclassified Sphingopyxis TaxID=2614943 RepID=UPI0028545216|nr:MULTISPECIES: FAD-dependent oxidoreductase [unclassified Sphingopyxis]MDR7060306.1 succinate dehydrogenase/fumarate reductase flavoprotein subunit [Sphingopyxis sp. BE235]MDR7180181.1 succinate dehydrogenase/fumarate reductase flavoprotein subunit [Sphingopyxis sp. BE249]